MACRAAKSILKRRTLSRLVTPSPGRRRDAAPGLRSLALEIAASVRSRFVPDAHRTSSAGL
jgi:hypothetical protein